MFSTPFSPCSLHDPPNLSHCVRLFPGIYNCSLPVLTCPLSNNLVHYLPWLLLLLGFIFIAFSPAHSPNLSTSFCNFFHVLIVYNFSVYVLLTNLTLQTYKYLKILTNNFKTVINKSHAYKNRLHFIPRRHYLPTFE